MVKWNLGKNQVSQIRKLREGVPIVAILPLGCVFFRCYSYALFSYKIHLFLLLLGLLSIKFRSHDPGSSVKFSEEWS